MPMTGWAESIFSDMLGLRRAAEGSAPQAPEPVAIPQAPALEGIGRDWEKAAGSDERDRRLRQVEALDAMDAGAEGAGFGAPDPRSYFQGLAAFGAQFPDPWEGR